MSPNHKRHSDPFSPDELIASMPLIANERQDLNNLINLNHIAQKAREDKQKKLEDVKIL